MTTFSEIWERLSTKGETRSGFIRLKIPEITVCSVYGARRIEDGSEAVVLESATASIPAKADYPETYGFRVQAVPISPGRSGRTRLILSLTDRRYRDIFHSLAQDIFTALVDSGTEKNAVSLFLSRLAKWQTFLRQHAHDGLSLEKRRGLLGELLLIRSHIFKQTDTDSAIASWKGCTAANHDFQFPGGSIEVKTTSAGSPHAFHVSNIRQLDSPGEQQLFLYFVVVDESDAGDESLPDVVNSIRWQINGPALEAFEECLFNDGYLEAQKKRYEFPRYSLRKERFYKVDDGFPRLLETALPDGIEDVKYKVAVAACSPFEIQPTDVLDAVISKVNEK